MNTMEGLVFIVLIFFAVVGIVSFIVDYWPIKIEKLSNNNKWVNKTIKRVAMDLIAKDFKERGKPIKTQKGDYRVDYSKAVAKKISEIKKICCMKDGYFRATFCEYVNDNYSSIVRKNLFNIIKKYLRHISKMISRNLEDFLNSNVDITPKQFFETKSKQSGDVVGVYVIYNMTKNMYYVGQAKRLFFRVNQHFTGHGNGDVYADYKYGDEFVIKIIKLSDSGYSDLDRLEKDLIKKYNAYDAGYNRTSGNR